MSLHFHWLNAKLPKVENSALKLLGFLPLDFAPLVLIIWDIGDGKKCEQK